VGEPEPMEAPMSSARPLVYAHMRGRERMPCTGAAQRARGALAPAPPPRRVRARREPGRMKRCTAPKNGLG